jgi:hypothetical protein
MSCYICQAEAVTRCYQCGALVCAEHGQNEICVHCSSGIAEGDPRADRISVKPLGKQKENAWWRPQQAEDYQPPACYACKALARAVCRNCQAIYCHEHRGPNGLCKDCGRSANLGAYVFVGVASVMLVLFLCHWLFG